MSDPFKEGSDLAKDVGNSLSQFGQSLSAGFNKFAAVPRMSATFNAASTGLKVAGGALLVGLLWKPALLVAAGSALYGAYKGGKAFSGYKPPQI